MRDTKGEKLEIGYGVVFSAQKANTLFTGVVTDFTARKVKITMDTDSYFKYKLKDPGLLLIIKK